VKKTKETASSHPTALFAHKHFGTKELAGSLARAGSFVASTGVEGPGYRRELLCARLPSRCVREAIVEVVAHLDAAQHGRHAADVVRMVVAGDHQVDGVDPERAKLGHDARRVSGIDERGLPSLPDQDCVALAHIEKAKLELLAPNRKGQAQKNEAEANQQEHETRPRTGILLCCG
jgi:hypothetical protein